MLAREDLHCTRLRTAGNRRLGWARAARIFGEQAFRIPLRYPEHGSGTNAMESTAVARGRASTDGINRYVHAGGSRRSARAIGRSRSVERYAGGGHDGTPTRPPQLE